MHFILRLSPECLDGMSVSKSVSSFVCFCILWDMSLSAVLERKPRKWIQNPLLLFKVFFFFFPPLIYLFIYFSYNVCVHPWANLEWTVSGEKKTWSFGPLKVCLCLWSWLRSSLPWEAQAAMLRVASVLHTMHGLREQVALPTMSSVCIGRDVSTINSSWEIKLLVSKMLLLRCSVDNTLYWSDFFTKALVKCLMACLKAECLVTVVPSTLDSNALCSQKIWSTFW